LDCPCGISFADKKGKATAISPGIRAIFGHFQNLNLLALLQDLRDGRTAQRTWFSGSLLCPVAHGLPDGPRVRELSVLGQATNLSEGCHFAARLLGAQPDAVLHFVRNWDEGAVSVGWLLRQLEEVWEERLVDAQVLQGLLQEGTSVPKKDVRKVSKDQAEQVAAATRPRD
jgi:hypothetical protein